MGFQDLGIKLLLLARSSSLLVILLQLQINCHLVLAQNLLNNNLVMAF
jgi:hypothetical protein